MNRPGLLFANGQIYIAWGSNGNNAPSQGWVMSYSAATLQQTGAVTLEPKTTLASIWQKGAGLAEDTLGNIYGVSGEGPYVAGSNLSTSVVKFSATNGVQVADYFTPYNHLTLSKNDLDLTGVLLFPPQAGPYPREMVAMGKEGTIYLLNRDQLGGLCTTCTTGDTQIIQEIPQGAGKGSGNPCFWNQRLYFTGQAGPVQAYTLQNGMLMVPPATSSQAMGGGGHCFVTANGATNGVLWILNGSTLFAFNAVTLQALYNSNQAPSQRDLLPASVHFPPAVATEGRVFVGTQNSLVTFGLL